MTMIRTKRKVSLNSSLRRNLATCRCCNSIASLFQKIKGSTSSENSGNTQLKMDKFDAIIPPKNTNTPSAMQSPSIKRSTSSENSGNTLLEVDEFGNKAYSSYQF
ncbi:hypothetical protein TrispH2_011815 [Trichoplax sp. H2]|nr:hypothetical protein TrispH2_011815 [Trichoplax sp. H2]|eukprot:RDD35894.1 hypothetical protein TrispH2_011815 [Trichoplax sp. H2]